jgi:hypothetical protein
MSSNEYTAYDTWMPKENMSKHETIDDILNQYRWACHEIRDNQPLMSEYANVRAEAKQKLAELIRRDVIGEDEPYLEEPSEAFQGAFDEANNMIESQNILRAEQRKAIHKAMGGK